MQGSPRGGGKAANRMQSRVPGQHEPRTANADELDPGDAAVGVERLAVLRSAKLAQHGQVVGGFAAGAAERSAGRFEDRRGQADDRIGAVLAFASRWTRRSAPLHQGRSRRGSSWCTTWNRTCRIGLVGDVFRLRQILTNLVTNAVKFTDQRRGDRDGGRARTGQDVAPLFCLPCRTRATGSPLDDQSRIFEPFIQSEAAVEYSPGRGGPGVVDLPGTGASHGGRIEGDQHTLGKPVLVLPSPGRGGRGGDPGRRHGSHPAATRSAGADRQQEPCQPRAADEVSVALGDASGHRRGRRSRPGQALPGGNGVAQDSG